MFGREQGIFVITPFSATNVTLGHHRGGRTSSAHTGAVDMRKPWFVWVRLAPRLSLSPDCRVDVESPDPLRRPVVSSSGTQPANRARGISQDLSDCLVVGLHDRDFVQQPIRSALFGNVLRAVGVKNVAVDPLIPCRYQFSLPVNCARSLLLRVFVVMCLPLS